MFYLHLEKIEMTGFKSFADKTVIEFDQGVTAVVGPNGSGKSNLSEAVRWVLGEQSAKNLRGNKMDDIVFAGSETRKPVNIAEVTLLFNNEDQTLPIDFSQVSITRRMNRNGESNCFINKKPCRLKDITDLLMDSGIGKDSFSMISQGKVEQIFQNKPEERRSIFEDAAGIAKYKSRKISAERKLDRTEEHLNRVEDILHEINNQLVPLEVQRNTAILYQNKKKELSDIEIALIAVEIETVNEQWQLSKKELIQYQERAKKLEVDQGRAQEYVSILKNKESKINEDVDLLQEENIQVIQKLEQLEGKKNILEQEADFSTKNKKQQEEFIQEKLKLIKEQELNLRTLSSKKEDISFKKIELQNQIKDFEKQEKELSENQNKRIQQLREDYIEKLQLQSTNKNTLLHLNKERERMDERINIIKMKSVSIKEKTVECTVKMEETITQIKEYGKNIKELEIKIKNNKEQLENLQKQQNILNENIQLVTRDLQQARARKESQQELEDSYADYYQGVKEILKRRKAIEGIHGPIGELLQVSEELSVAIDTALGSAIQHIVVSDPSSASKCISILKNNRLGRATFLPLSVIKGKALPASNLKKLETTPGFIGMADQLVKYQESYKNIASHLLGTTIISRDLQSGISISKIVQNRYRVVSLEGDVIHAGGSMTGGATKKQQKSSVFSRKNTIQKLVNEIENQSERYKKLKSEFDSKQYVIHQYENQIEQGQIKWNELLFQLEKRTDSKNRDLEKLNLLEEEKASAQYEEKTLVKNLSEVEQQIITEEELRQSISNEIIEIKRDMQTSTMGEEERISRLNTIQKELQNIQQMVAVLLEREKQIGKDIQNCKHIIETEQRAVDVIENNLEKNMKQESTQIQFMNEVIQSLTIQNQKKREITQSLKMMRNDKKELEQSVEANRMQLQELTHSLKSTWTEIAKLESSSGRYEVAIDHHLNRLSEEYGLSFEIARKEYRLSLTTEEASATVHRLKDEIDHLGVVNLASIEEFERISKRYDFLTEQQNDLITAKKILLDTMNKMDQEVSTRFEKKFYEIKNQFEITFPKLFGGGKATIQLTDPTNILETGIEITAQPPGKRLQQLSLLSGGEKAFTAIALLFSIIEVSSVPFCILDEVEAALDEANVTRFGKYVSSFEGKTQFIIITHRKGTMQEADVLYGVTMQDSGVSKLASVRFDNQEDGS